MEIITGVERRRRWRLEEKLRIVAEAEEPGANLTEVARRHDVSRALLWNWRRQVRNGELALPTTAQFLPVQMVAEAPAMPAEPLALPRRQPAVAGDAVIEIGLPDGTTVRVGRDVGAVALRRVLGALRG
ncbi:transposase [Rhodovastum atsumiense]|uniref:IS66-like element accessory protein TnpA n=1 Tax=Rhodovastum atsumiense TaxID=504468 RepID=UPI00139F295D|nr:transposase [Rhodovastum atsumiense]CAH2603397.1 transposase [Rhodovastum atsumiense]